MKQQTTIENTALLVMDVQNAIIGSLEEEHSLMNSLIPTIKTARKHSIPVIYVVVGFREGYPEVSSRNKSFSRIQDSKAQLDTRQARKIHEAVSPEPDDLVITKKRYSAFTGSDLQVVLRSNDIRHLVLTGISTSGVVLSTVCEAADKDYRLTVLSDCCADHDKEVHRVLTEKVFPTQADVMDSEAWSQALLNS